LMLTSFVLTGLACCNEVNNIETNMNGPSVL
jgi:hypothetical protein